MFFTLLLLTTLKSSYCQISHDETSIRADAKVCIIGAGVAGLTSAKHLRDKGITFTVLEATDHVGGTWYYEPRVGTDKYGMPVISSMYKNLRTNLPKQTMTLTGYPMPDDVISFPTRQVFYDYLAAYSRHFHLEKNIQFGQFVELVTKSNNLWRIKHKDVKTGHHNECYCEYVFVCNGHHNTPRWPNIKGEDKFKGSITHSHDYRIPDPFKDRRVLIIGNGPSGRDIGLDVASVSKVLIHSHHRKAGGTPYPAHYIMKPDVKEFNETGVFFADGTYEDIDDVIYCTGYDYTLPFLDSTSGITLGPKSVTPLYKHIVNINNPTMLFLGLNSQICVVTAIDAQARYAAALANGSFTLPPREVMMKEWQDTVDELKKQGLPMSTLHFLDQKEDEYYRDLAEESGIERVPPVLSKLRAYLSILSSRNLITYRNNEVNVKDDFNFEFIYKVQSNIKKQ